MARIALGLLIAALLWFGANRLQASALAQRASWPKTAGNVLLPPPGSARIVSLGYNELLTDITWCRALVYYGSNWAGEGDLSYLPQFIDVIYEADPHFKAAHDWAPYAITYRSGTATQEEFLLSIEYLRRAMREFPEKYEYFWFAGTRYYWDLWSPDKAVTRGYRETGAELIEQAMQKPDAPPDLATTAANMRGKLGQHERAIANLRQMFQVTDNDKARAKMLERLRVEDPGLADELDLEQQRLEDTWKSAMPAVPLDFFVLLGPPPPRVIDFRTLTTPTDLFGVDAPEDGPTSP